MSLNNNQQYNFYLAVIQVIDFLTKNNLDLFDIKAVMSAQSPNDSFVKVYINFNPRIKKVMAHKPTCSAQANLISGIGEATENGFWIGMLKRDQIIRGFSSIQKFVDSLGQFFQLQNNSLCKNCGV